MADGLMFGVDLLSEVVALALLVLLPRVNLDKPSPRLRNGLFVFAASAGASFREETVLTDLNSPNTFLQS